MKIEEIVRAIQDNDYFSLDKLLKKLAQKKADRKGKKPPLASLNSLVPPHNVAPLHIAAACGSLDAGRLLLEQSAFVDVEDTRGARPLHYACANAQPAFARMLLDWGASANRPILHDGRSPMHCAVVGARRCNQLDFMHRTLSVACGLAQPLRPCEAARPGSTAAELVALLLQSDADLNARDAAGRSAFEYACELGNSEFLAAFLATPNGRAHLESVCTAQLETLRNSDASVPLEWPPFTGSHLAAKNGHTAVLRLLCNGFISLGVLQLRSVNGTPLHEAVLNARLDTLEFLVQNGVDLGIRNSHGHTALDLTCILEAGRVDRTLVDEIRRTLTSGNKEDAQAANGASMWRSYVTNDSLFAAKPPSLVPNGSQSPRRSRPLQFANNSTSPFGSPALQLPLECETFKSPPALAIYNNLSAINFTSSPDELTQAGLDAPRLCSSFYSNREPCTFNQLASNSAAHCCSLTCNSHGRLNQCSHTPFGQCPCAVNATRCQCQNCSFQQACCNTHVSQANCPCNLPKDSEDSHRHSSASVDSGHGSNDLKHMHSPISPCDSAVSSSRNSAHSMCQKSQSSFQPHACATCLQHRCVPAAVPLNVTMPTGSLVAPSGPNAPSSAAGSSSGSSSQGDMESGVSFSSMSSLENIDEYFLEDPLDLNALFSDGLSDNDVLQHWLNALQLPEYYENFVGAGYDIATIARMTPEDLTAIGITNPKHRRRLRAELRRLNVDLPQLSRRPTSLYEWLTELKLDCYHRLLNSQGYSTLEKVAHGLAWDDMEEIGIVLLGHQKKLMVAIGRLRKLLQCSSGRDAASSSSCSSSSSRCHGNGNGSESHCPHGNCQCSRRDQSTNMNAAEKVLADILNAAENNRLDGTDADQDAADGLPATLKSLRTLDRLRETAELSRSCGNVNTLGLLNSPFAPAAFNTCANRTVALAPQSQCNSSVFTANLQAAYSALRCMQQSSAANEQQPQLVQSANNTPVHRLNKHFVTKQQNQPYASPLISRHLPASVATLPSVPKRQHSLTLNHNSSLKDNVNGGSPSLLRRVASDTAHAHCVTQRNANLNVNVTVSNENNKTTASPSHHYRTLPHRRSSSQRISSVPEQDESDACGSAQQCNTSNTGLHGSSASIDSVNTSSLPFANDNCGTIRPRPCHSSTATHTSSSSTCQSSQSATVACSSQSLTSSPKDSVRKTADRSCFSPGSSLSSSSSSCSSANTVLLAPLVTASGNAHEASRNQNQNQPAHNLDDLNSILNDLSSAFDNVLSS